MAALLAGSVIWVASSRARATYCGVRMVRKSATSVFSSAVEKRRAVPTLSRLTARSPERLIDVRERISVGTPARRPMAVVPVPPWCTTARQVGKMVAKFIVPTTLTWSEWGTLLKSVASGAHQRPLT